MSTTLGQGLGQSLPEGHTFSENDVILGSPIHSKHSGNIKLEVIAKVTLERLHWTYSSEKDKNEILGWIFNQVRKNGGRFITKFEDREWREATAFDAIEKIRSVVELQQKQANALQPGPNDVVFGYEVSYHQANNTYLALVYSMASVQNASVETVTAKVRKEVADKGGRFLEQDAVTKRFRELSVQEVNMKIARAIQGSATVTGPRTIQVLQKQAMQPSALGSAGESNNINNAAAYYQADTPYGDPMGLFRLGENYRLGIVGRVNKNLAFHCYFLAANKGLPIAQKMVGDCYVIGYGTKQCFKTAAKFYGSALRQGLQTAKRSLEELFREVNTQIKAGKQSPHMVNICMQEAGLQTLAASNPSINPCPSTQSVAPKNNNNNNTNLQTRTDSQQGTNATTKLARDGHAVVVEKVNGTNQELIVIDADTSPQNNHEGQKEAGSKDLGKISPSTQSKTMEQPKKSVSELWDECREICLGKKLSQKRLHSGASSQRQKKQQEQLQHQSQGGADSLEDAQLRELARLFSTRSELFQEIERLERVLEEAEKVQKHIFLLRQVGRFDQFRPLSRLAYEIRMKREKLAAAAAEPTCSDCQTLSDEIAALTEFYEQELEAFKIAESGQTETFPSNLGAGIIDFHRKRPREVKESYVLDVDEVHEPKRCKCSFCQTRVSKQEVAAQDENDQPSQTDQAGTSGNENAQPTQTGEVDLGNSRVFLV